MKKQYPWEIQGKRKTNFYEKRNIYGMTVPERIRAIIIDVIIILSFMYLSKVIGFYLR